MHRDQLAENSVGALTARPPALDAADERFGAHAEGALDEPLFRRGVEIDGPRRDVRATRDINHAQIGESPASHLAQRGALDRAPCTCGVSGAFALHVAAQIHFTSSVAEDLLPIDREMTGRYR